MLAGGREDAAESLAHLTPIVVAHLGPLNLLDADGVEDTLFHERKKIAAGRMSRDQHEVRHARVAVMKDRPRIAFEFAPRGVLEFAQGPLQSGEGERLIAADATGHGEQMAEGDVGLARIGQGHALGQPVFVIHLGIQG